jgi:hypothetical protein
MRILGNIILFLFVILVLWHGVMGTIWQINNPKANQMTFYTHYSDAMHGRVLPQFQE